MSSRAAADMARIPVSMLRQLEWGYLRNWPKGLYGRTQLVRYARASGLSRQLVLARPAQDQQLSDDRRETVDLSRRGIEF